MGDDTTIQVDRIGRTCIGFLELEALFVPQFRISLVSVSKLAAIGLRTIFDNVDCSVFDSSNRVFLKAYLRDGLYLVSRGYNAERPKLEALITTRAQAAGQARQTPNTQTPNTPLGSPVTELHPSRRSNKQIVTDSLHLWHRRFAHMNPVALKQILEQAIPTKLRLINDHDPTCDICLRSKHQQKLNRTEATRSKVPFELIHSDSCGPIARSFGGSAYYILFVTGASHGLAHSGTRSLVLLLARTLGLRFHYGEHGREELKDSDQISEDSTERT